MRGIDVSNHQNDIDIFKIACDFVIVKATEGKTYVSPSYKRQATETLASGKLLGLYHYVNGKSSPNEEMNNFVKAFIDYDGRALPVLDWESYTNAAWGDDSYLSECVKIFKSLTGLTPVIYASLSMFPNTVANTHGCARWVAQYANEKATGWQNTPWNEGAYSCAIRQYTSKGQINGYAGYLDLDKAYISGDEWRTMCQPNSNNAEKPTQSDVFNRLAKRVINGEFGNGNDKRQNAIYQLIRNEVNRSYQGKSALDSDAREVAEMVKAGRFGNGHTTRAKKIYSEVRKRVNACYNR